MEKPWQLDADRLTLTIRVVPGASKNEILLHSDGSLRVRVNAPPLDGRANEALIRFLSKSFGCKRSEIALLSGQKSKLKRIALPASCLPSLQKTLNLGP